MSVRLLIALLEVPFFLLFGGIGLSDGSVHVMDGGSGPPPPKP
jgi:hypothetical protein